MPKVFVHGNPETTSVWSDLVPALEQRGVDDVVLLAPPGFGAPVPDGFGATRTEYRDWLVGELQSLGGGVDLVGHDWGAGHVFAVAAHRPDLLRSWAADCAGLLHPDYEWHAAAQTWQTPGDGEESVALMTAVGGDELAAAMAVPERMAHDIAAALDDTMGRCILSLYRSARQPALRELGDELAAAERRPALLIDATADPYVGSELVGPVAERLGADVLTLPDRGHWWMFEDPGAAADGLVSFWGRADG